MLPIEDNNSVPYPQKAVLQTPRHLDAVELEQTLSAEHVTGPAYYLPDIDDFYVHTQNLQHLLLSIQTSTLDLEDPTEN